MLQPRKREERGREGKRGEERGRKGAAGENAMRNERKRVEKSEGKRERWREREVETQREREQYCWLNCKSVCACVSLCQSVCMFPRFSVRFSCMGLIFSRHARGSVVTLKQIIHSPGWVIVGETNVVVQRKLLNSKQYLRAIVNNAMYH